MEHLPLSTKKNAETIPVFGIRTVREGEDDVKYKINLQGSRVLPFTFSGGVKALAEFHRALVKLERSAKHNTMPELDEVKDQEVDKHGFVDFSKLGQTMYTEKVVTFSDFCAFVREHAFKASGGEKDRIVSYQALILTKKKSEKALKSSKSKKPFFDWNCASRYIKNLRLACEYVMRRNDIKPLPLDDVREVNMTEEEENAAMSTLRRLTSEAREKRSAHNKQIDAEIQSAREKLAAERDKLDESNSSSSEDEEDSEVMSSESEESGSETSSDDEAEIKIVKDKKKQSLEVSGKSAASKKTEKKHKTRSSKKESEADTVSMSEEEEEEAPPPPPPPVPTKRELRKRKKIKN